MKNTMVKRKMNTQIVTGLLVLLSAPLMAQNPSMSPRIQEADYPQLAAWFNAQTPCSQCGTGEIVVDQDSTVDFSGATPVFNGDARLAPFFRFEQTGSQPSGWKAVFDLGDQALRLTQGVGIRVTGVPIGRGAAVPGLEIRTTCTMDVAGTIELIGDNEATGDLTLVAAAGLTVSGTVRNAIAGTWATTGNINLAVGCGELTITPEGLVFQEGTQQGAKQVNLLAFGEGGNIQVDGRVEATFSNLPAPVINLGAFAGQIQIDGTRLLGVDASGNPITSGVHLLSKYTAAPDTINLMARDDLVVLGYGSFAWSGQPSATFTLDRILRDDSPSVPVTVTLENSAADEVRVSLSIPAGSGALRALFGNLLDENSAPQLVTGGADLGPKQVIGANTTHGIPNYWMGPPGYWDFGLGLGRDDQTLTSASITLSAPGLVWQHLLSPQQNGHALGVIISDLPGNKNDDGFARMGMTSPLFGEKQIGTVAVKAKRGINPGGTIHLQSLRGSVRATDHALDVAGGNGNGNAAISIEAADSVVLESADPALAGIFGARPVLTSSQPGGPAGTNTVRAYAGGITIAEGVALLAEGSSSGGNHLIACTGVTQTGVVSPADADTSNDSGVCPPALTLTVGEPLEGAYINSLPFSVSGTVSPAEATVSVNGTALSSGQSQWTTPLTLPEGPQTLTVTADYVTQTRQEQRQIIVDTLPPTIALNAPAAVTAGTTLDFNWLVEDASPVTVSVRLAGTVVATDAVGAFAYPVPLDPNLSLITLDVSAQDAAGNTADPVQVNVVVNLPPTTIVIDQPVEGFATNAAEITVSGTVTPAQSTVSVNGLSAVVGDGAWQLTLPLSGEGVLPLTAVAASPVGNATAQVSIVRDITPPGLSLSGPASVEGGAPFQLQWLAEDARPLEGVELRLVDVVLATEASGLLEQTAPTDRNITSLTYVLVARDDLGNQAQTEHLVTIVHPELVLAIGAPTADFLTNGAGIEVSGTVTPGAAVTVNALAATVLGGDWSVEVPLNSEGPITLTANATLGAATASAEVQIIRDITPPVVHIDHPEHLLRGSTHPLGVSATDLHEVVSVALTAGSQNFEPVAAPQATFQLHIPADDPAENITLTAHATDAAGNTGSATAALPIIDISSLPAVVITLENPAHASLFGEPETTITGIVSPTDAALNLAGVAVTLNGDGRFELPVTLTSGLNTFLFRATAENHRPGQAKLDLYLDDIDPVVTLLSPEADLRTNQAELEIYGTVTDQYDEQPILTRAGVELDLNGGRFNESVTLEEGENTFLYTATDSLGHSGAASLTVWYETSLVTVELNHPSHIEPGAAYTAAALFSPLPEVVRTEVYVNHELVWQGTDGQAYEGGFTHSGNQREIPLMAVAIDRYGNRVEKRGEILVAYPHFVHGKVLADTTSFPVAGIPVTVSTPMGAVQLTTDELGRYETYVYGFPLDVVVAHGSYARLQRHMPFDMDSWRVPDLRLTALADPQPVGTHVAGDSIITLSGGFSGSARVTNLGAQGIPELLPLGYAPLAALELAGVSGTGDLNWQITNSFTPAPATTVALLQQSGRGWQVLAVTSPADSYSFPGVTSGAYLIAALDAWQAAAPNPSSYLERSEDPVVPPNTLAQSLAEPARVSVYDDPQTRFTCALATAGELVSGVRARLTAREVHERYSRTLHVPDYELDFFAYSVGFGDSQSPSVLGGHVHIRAREQVLPDETQRADISFYALPGHREQASFPQEQSWYLGNLTLDFSNTADGPRAIHAQQSTLTLQGLTRATPITAFTVEIGGGLDRSLTLHLDAPDSGAMLLLQRRPGTEQWDYQGRLQYNGQGWTNSGAGAQILRGGDFLLLATNYAVSEISGTVTHGGTPVGDADVYVETLPWRALSADDGTYRLALPQDPDQRTIHAHHSGLRREGSVLIPASTGSSSIGNQDISLVPRNFRLLAHNPFHQQAHVTLLPGITLEFNRPVTTDVDLLRTAVQLNGPGGAVPLEVVALPGRREIRLLPLQALTTSTNYTLSLDGDLESLDGDPLSEATSFSFTTRVPTLERAVDLSAFYLAWENDRLYVRGPEEAYAPGTRLRVFNPENGAGYETTLISGAYSGELAGMPGDPVELRATDPTGAEFQRTIDLLQTAPDTFRIGNRPFVLRINGELVLRVDEVLDGFGSELKIQAAAPTALDSSRNEVVAFEDAPAMTAVQGIELQVISGTLPRMNLRLQLERDLNEFNGRTLMPMTLQPGVLVPTDPTQLDLITPQTMARIHDAVLIEDGAPAGEAGKRFNLAGMMARIEVSAISGVATVDLAGQSVFLSIMASAAPLNAAEHPVSDYVECARRHIELDPPIQIPTVTGAAWHQYLEPGYYPVPGVPIYEIIPVDGGAPRYRILGVSDGSGRADCHHFYSGLGLRGVDPVTNQIESPGVRSEDNVFNQTGFSLLTYRMRPLNFDPEEYMIELGNPPPPLLKSRWEVGTLENGAFVADAEKTTRLRNDRRVIEHSSLQLRLTVQSSQGIATEPPPNLSLVGLVHPGNPEIDGNNITWTFAPGVLSSGGLVESAVTLHSNIGTENTLHDRFIIVGEGPAADIPGAAPFVLYTNPEDEAEKVLISDAVVVAFSEPVGNIGDTTVRLRDDTGGTIAATRYNRLGEEITESDQRAAIVHLIPLEGLDFDQTYVIEVDGVTDAEDLGLEEPFQAHFKTTKFERADNLATTYRTQVIGLQNLVLVLNEDWNQGQFQVSVYDTRHPYKPMTLLGTHQLQKGPQDAFMRMELFTPKELEETGTGLAPRGDEGVALDDLPSGTILVVTRQRFPNDVSATTFYKYSGGTFEKRYDYDNLEKGLCYDLAKMGRYLILGYKNLGYWNYEDFIPAKTVIMDVAEMVQRFEEVSGGSQDRILEFEAQIQSLALVAKYPLPGDVSSLTSFSRKEFDGDFVAVKPGFLASGYGHPAIYDFDLNVQPQFPGMAMPSDSPDHDGRLLVRTAWQNGPTALRLDNGFISSFAYRPPGGGLKEVDLAIFMERGQDGRLLFFEVPRTGGTGADNLDPVKTLVFPNGLHSMAVEPGSGLIAVQGSDRRFSMLDVKTYLETPVAQDLPGFTHPAFMFEAVAQEPQLLTFIEGHLFGHDSSGRRLNRTPVVPRAYRAVGFEYYDLFTWSNPSEEEDAPQLTDQVKFARSMVYYATDMPHEDALVFVMEQGSFAVELSDGGDISVTIEDSEGTSIGTMERNNLVGQRTESFALKPIRDHFSNTANQVTLREKGMARYTITYTITKDGVQEAEDELNFAVVYRAPDTRYIDHLRTAGEFDLLSLSPNLHETDHELSNLLPQVNLSPQRMYHVDYAFQGGHFGVGMLSSQMLHIALPTWWRLDQLGAGVHDGTHVYPRVIVEQPGHVQSWFELEEDGDDSDALNSLNSGLKIMNGYWRFGAENRVFWHLKARDPLPYYADTFAAVNNGVDEAEKLRYPVFRYTPPSVDAPPALLGVAATRYQTDIAWQNTMRFQDGANQPSAYPEKMQERVNDNGGQRESALVYEQATMGKRISEIRLPDGIKLTYRYDEDGYLEEVLKNGQRPTIYEWDDLGMELGDLKLKRLVGVTRGEGAASAEARFIYQEPNYKVSRLSTDFGERTLLVQAATNGLPNFTIIPGSRPELNRGVAFDLQEGNYLSSVEHCGLLDFTISWEKKERFFGGVSWLYKGHQHMDQSFEYDDQGRLIRHTRNGGGESWQYENGLAGFEAFPTAYRDAAGQDFTLETNRAGASIHFGGASQSWQFSGSGVPIVFEDAMGFNRRASGSIFYALAGQGYQQSNGRPTREPLQVGSNHALSTYSYNALGDMAQLTRMGSATTYSGHDALGRPAQIQANGGAIPMDVTYAFQDGMYVTTSTDNFSGLVQTSYYNEAGKLVAYEEKMGESQLRRDYAYDSLGRLLAITDGAGNPIYEAVFSDDSTQPIRIEADGEAWTFAKAPGFHPRITSVTREVAGKSRVLTYVTDELGRVVETEIPGRGAATLSYDGFGRLTTNTSSTGQLTMTYGNRSIRINDELLGKTTDIQINDELGLNRTVLLSGDGIEPSQKTINTAVVGDAAGKGFVFRADESGGLYNKARLYNLDGESLGAATSRYSLEADPNNLNRYGEPVALSGSWNQAITRDTLGRVTDFQLVHGQNLTTVYDNQGRPTSGTDFRGKPWEAGYFNATQNLANLKTNGVNSQGTDSVDLLVKTDLLSEASTSWLGADFTQSTLTLDSNYQLTNGSQSGSWQRDPQTGMVTSLNGFGIDLNLQWEVPGKKVRITGLDGTSTNITLDAWSRPIRVDQSGGTNLEIIRDAEGRTKTIRRNGQVRTINYDGEHIVSVSGPGDTVFYEDYQATGDPGRVRLGNQMVIDMTYHSGGIPKRLTVRPAGSLPTILEHNNNGDLIFMRRGLDEPVSYTYNEWGVVDTIQSGSQKAAQKLMPEFGTLNLPGKVEAGIDERGRLVTLTAPGLLAKSFTYGPDDSLAGVSVDNQPAQTYLTQNNQLTRLTHEPILGLQGLQQDFSYDPQGRPSQVDSSLDGGNRFDYLADEDNPDYDHPQADFLEAFTDPNGVTQNFTYDQYGNLIRIDVANGPTFIYSYDEAGKLTSVGLDGMSASFADYSNGRPESIQWDCPDCTIPPFVVRQDAEGYLQQVDNGAFLLDLDWTQVPGEESSRIAQIIRKGPELAETLVPSYSVDNQLNGVTITRVSGSNPSDPNCADCRTDQIEEQYGEVTNQLIAGLQRVLNGTTLLDLTHSADVAADSRRIGAQTYAGSGQVDLTYDGLGNLTEIQYPWDIRESLTYDGARTLRGITTTTTAGTHEESYRYDYRKRRIANTGIQQYGNLVYLYRESRVIAMGLREPGQEVRWTHAVGHGPLGPVFIRDLTGGGNDYFIFTDHLGTPFAYHNMHNQQTYYTPYNPWGELLAPHPAPAPAYAAVGALTEAPFQLPPDAVFPSTPLGLSGHIYDHTTGLTYMHNRYYHPRLGHFLNPDFRIPDLYDPSTLKEPYAYASGDPIMYWDPTGLYRRNIHGYFVYLAAYAAGFPEDRAREIALFAWAPDATKDLNAIDIFKRHVGNAFDFRKVDNPDFMNFGFDPEPDITTEGDFYRKLIPFTIEKVDRSELPNVELTHSLHALPSGEFKNILYFRKNANLALQTLQHPMIDFMNQHLARDLSVDQKFGILTHYFQDTFSHTNTSWWFGAGEDTTDPNQAAYTPLVGHLFDWTHPDTPRKRPILFRAMASAYYDQILSYASRNGLTPRISKDDFLTFSDTLTQIKASFFESQEHEDEQVSARILAHIRTHSKGAYGSKPFLPDEGAFGSIYDLMYRKKN